MGVTATLIAGVATAVSAGGAAYSAHQRKEAREEQRDESKRRAKLEVQRLEEEEERLLSRQRAAYAASGVRLEGSPLAVIKDTQEQAAREREEVIRRGAYSADLLGQEASEIWTTGMWNTAGTLLSGASSTYRTGRQTGVFK